LNPIEDILDTISQSFTTDYEAIAGKPTPVAELSAQVDHDAVLHAISASKYADVLQFMRVEADELWSFVGNKAQKAWVWLAMNSHNRQIIGFAVGDRSAATAKQLLASLPPQLTTNTIFCTDFLKTYDTIFAEEQHHKGGKDIGFVNRLERFNCTLRQRCARLVRKTLSFSKSLDLHIKAIRYFLCHYNKALNIQ
jgi:insertion element IS1 protein InsB